MLLWLFLVSGLVEGSLSSGILYPESPVPVVSTSEAHGPLARLALASSGGSFPYYTHQRLAYNPDVFGLPPSPVAHAVNVDHRLSTAPPCDNQPAVAGSKHTTAKFQVKRPTIQKQFYEIEERTVRPIGTAIVDINGPIPFSAGKPQGYQAVSQYRPAYSYPFSTYPFVYYHPFQTPVQAYPPPFVQQSQGFLQIPQQTPAYPQQPIVAPRPPQQSPTYPQQPIVAPRPPQQSPTYPQQPIVAPRPPQQSPTYPQQSVSEPRPPEQPPTYPQKPVAKPPVPNPVPQPPSSSTGNEEFDYSDTVVIDNPDFERFSNREGQLKTPPETLSRSFQKGEEPCNEEKEAKRILEEFQNRQILRQFGIKQNQFVQGIEPSQIQTIQELEELGMQLRSGDGLEEAIKKSPTNEKSSRNEKSPAANQDAFRSSTSDREIIHRTLKTAPSDSSPEEGHSNQRRLLEILSAYEEASIAEGVVHGRLVTGVTPLPDDDGLTERVSSRGVTESQLTLLVKPTLAAAVIYRR